MVIIHLFILTILCLLIILQRFFFVCLIRLPLLCVCMCVGGKKAYFRFNVIVCNLLKSRRGGTSTRNKSSIFFRFAVGI